MDMFANTNIANTSLGLFPQQPPPMVDTTVVDNSSVVEGVLGTDVRMSDTLIAEGDLLSTNLQTTQEPNNNLRTQLQPPPQALDVAQLQAVLTESIARGLQPQLNTMTENMANELRSINARVELVDQQFQMAQAQLARESKAPPPLSRSEDPQLSGKRPKPAGPPVPEDPKGKRHQSAAAKQQHRNMAGTQINAGKQNSHVPDIGGARQMPELIPHHPVMTNVLHNAAYAVAPVASS